MHLFQHANAVLVINCSPAGRLLAGAAAQRCLLLSSFLWGLIPGLSTHRLLRARLQRAGRCTVPPPGEARQPQPPSSGFLNRRGRRIRSRRSSREPGLTRGPGSARQGRPRVHLGAGRLISAPRSFRITDGDRTASRVRSQPCG
ncbi:hypothetical protein NDU88_001720 [Pleurodeles waltl]|uniref:Uncharacterized protein n=1 Tax=Pleurodeles waltl TaxID=8319 RepID=A0AAV7LYF6_PLEWA|nr:hypothetical protein NDU88_001720 [Pleurodeles waltl]